MNLGNMTIGGTPNPFQHDGGEFKVYVLLSGVTIVATEKYVDGKKIWRDVFKLDKVASPGGQPQLSFEVFGFDSGIDIHAPETQGLLFEIGSANIKATLFNAYKQTLEKFRMLKSGIIPGRQ